MNVGVSVFMTGFVLMLLNSFSMIGLLYFVVMWMEGRCSRTALLVAFTTILGVSDLAIIEIVLHSM